MNDEIKEILDYWRFYINEPNVYKLLNVHFDEIKTILDYITNLQQENERLTQGATLLTNKLIDMTQAKGNYKSRIDEAIQYLKCHTIIYKCKDEEFCELDEYFNPYWCIDILNGNDEGLETLKTFIDYKERVRKASEYILDHHPDNSILPQGLWAKLLDILQGDNNENY